MLGVARGALVRQPITQFILREDQDIYYLHHKQIFETHSSDSTSSPQTSSGQAGSPQVCELRMKRPDDNPIWVRIEATATHDADGRPVCRAAISDITERKQAEKALREREEKFRGIFENVLDVYYETAIDGTILEVSPSIEILSKGQYHRDDLIGKSMNDFYSDPGKRQILMEALQERGNVMDYEIKLKNRDGLIIPCSISSVIRFDAQGRPERILGTIRDITERKKAEEMLQDIIEKNPMSVQILDKEGFTIQVNSAHTKLFGSVPPSDYSIFTDVQLIQQGMGEIFERLKNGEVVQFPDTHYSVHSSIPELPDIPVWIRAIGFPLNDNNNKPERFVFMHENITERKQAEIQIQYQANLLTNVSDAILATDRQFNIQFWNTAAEKQYGWTSAEVLGSHFMKFIQPQYIGDSRRTVMQKILQEGFWKGELLHNRRDGTLFPVQVTISEVRNTKGQIVGHITINRDITERKRAEEALRKSEEKYRGLTENINLGIYRNTVGPEGKFIEANPAIIGMFGYKNKEEFLAINVSDLYQNPKDRNMFDDKMFKEGFVRGEELWLKKKDGSLFVGSVSAVTVKDIQGDVKYYDGIIDDITERKQAEAALHESLERFHLANHATFDIIWDWNIQTNALWWNENFRLLFGYKVEEIEPDVESWTNRIHPEDVDRVKTDIYAAIDIGRQSWSDQYRFRRKDGTYAVIDDRGYISRDANGTPMRMIGAMQDITERKRAEEEIRKLNVELEQRVKERTVQLETANKELEAFSYSISHDLRAPLRAIDGFAHILQEDYAPNLDTEGKRACSIIQESIGRMNLLIDDLLALSRLGRTEIQFTQINMDALAKSVYDELTDPEERERIDFHIEPLCPAVGDFTLIRQVWINLLGNAIKFSSGRERAIIEVKGDEHSDEIIYSISDNGVGFDMQYADKLFGVFQRLHSEKEFTGTGVGLAIVNRIIRRHSGRVWAEGKVNEGATFWFSLPAGK
jgi:PAS domain S-box-containing protein